jgi:hypothetical protein
VEIEEVIIAYDALTVIVNPANKVSKLTREQLEVSLQEQSKLERSWWCLKNSLFKGVFIWNYSFKDEADSNM